MNVRPKIHISFKRAGIAVLALALTAICAEPSAAQDELTTEELENLPANIVDRVDALEGNASDFIELLASESYDEAYLLLSESLQSRLSVSDIETRWGDILSEAGELIDYRNARYEWGVNSDFVSLEIEFENAEGDLLLTFNSNQRIVGLDFPPVRTETPQQLAEALVDSLAMGDFVEARRYLHPILKGELSTYDIEQKWTRLQLLTGDFQERLRTEVRDTGDVRIVEIVLRFEEMEEEFLVLVNDHRQIVGVDFPRE